MQSTFSSFPPALPASHTAVVIGAEITAQQKPLFPNEESAIAKAVPKRIREYVASRSLAREAMTVLGFPAAAVDRGPRREPLWPQGLTGSLTHTDQHCACAMGPSSSIRGVGIDMEVIGRATPNLWDRLFTQEERLTLEALPESDRDYHATILFTAKEAFYKLQYPLTGAWLGFTDVQVERGDTDRFTLSVLNPPDDAGALPLTITGQVSSPFPDTLLSQIWHT